MMLCSQGVLVFISAFLRVYDRVRTLFKTFILKFWLLESGGVLALFLGYCHCAFFRKEELPPLSTSILEMLITVFLF